MLEGDSTQADEVRRASWGRLEVGRAKSSEVGSVRRASKSTSCKGLVPQENVCFCGTEAF